MNMKPRITRNRPARRTLPFGRSFLSSKLRRAPRHRLHGCCLCRLPATGSRAQAAGYIDVTFAHQQNQLLSFSMPPFFGMLFPLTAPSPGSIPAKRLPPEGEGGFGVPNWVPVQYCGPKQGEDSLDDLAGGESASCSGVNLAGGAAGSAFVGHSAPANSCPGRRPRGRRPFCLTRHDRKPFPDTKARGGSPLAPERREGFERAGILRVCGNGWNG